MLVNGARRQFIDKHTAADVVASLQATPVLRELPTHILHDCTARGRTEPTSRDGMIFGLGDPASVHLVARGRVAILMRPSPQIELQLFTHHPKDLIGEVSILLGRHIDEARALETSVVISLPVDSLRKAILASQAATRALAHLTATRLAIVEARLGEVAVHSLRERLLFILQRLSEHAPRDSRGYLLSERLTRPELARLVGATREAVSRALARLVREGHIILNGRRIILRRRSDPVVLARS